MFIRSVVLCCLCLTLPAKATTSIWRSARPLSKTLISHALPRRISATHFSHYHQNTSRRGWQHFWITRGTAQKTHCRVQLMQDNLLQARLHKTIPKSRPYPLLAFAGMGMTYYELFFEERITTLKEEIKRVEEEASKFEEALGEHIKETKGIQEALSKLDEAMAARMEASIQEVEKVIRQFKKAKKEQLEPTIKDMKEAVRRQEERAKTLRNTEEGRRTTMKIMEDLRQREQYIRSTKEMIHGERERLRKMRTSLRQTRERLSQ